MNTKYWLLASLLFVRVLSATPSDDPLDKWDFLNPAAELWGAIDADYGEGHWVVTTGRRQIITLSDGADWRVLTNQFMYNGPQVGFGTVKYANSHWITYASADPEFLFGRSAVLTSTDGIDWNQVGWGPFGQQLFGLTFGNGKWLAKGALERGGATVWYSSTDEVSWQPINLPAGILAEYFYPKFGAGEWLAIGEEGIFASPDLEHWSVRPYPHEVDEGWHQIAYGAGTWVLTFNSNTFISYYWTSTDGVNWQPLPAAIPPYHSFLWVNNMWILSFSSGRADQVFVSTNLLDWTSAALMAPTRTIAYGQEKWLGINVANQLLSSRNARTWSVVTAFPPDQQFKRLRFGGGIWLLSGSEQDTNIVVLSSRDGQNWNRLALSLESGAIQSLRYSDGKWSLAYVPTSAQTLRVLESVDAQNWTVSNIPQPISDLVFGNGQWLAIGPSGADCRPLMVSTNLTDWQKLDEHGFLQLEYANGLYYALVGPCIWGCCGGEEYDVITSTDGNLWTHRFKGVQLADITLANGRLLAVGEYGSILQSDPLLSLQKEPLGELIIRKASGLPAQVEVSDDLLHWLTLTNIPPGPILQSVDDPNLTAPYRFYRARVQ
jgi:hypothetical protein